MFAAFVLGVPIFAVLVEFVGYKTGDKRYDALGYEFTKLLFEEDLELPERADAAVVAGAERVRRREDAPQARARVGNFYVNRNQIGAIVESQPFGGEGLSGTGPKAGGPHYLARFATERVTCIDTTAAGGNASLLASL